MLGEYVNQLDCCFSNGNSIVTVDLELLFIHYTKSYKCLEVLGKEFLLAANELRRRADQCEHSLTRRLDIRTGNDTEATDRYIEVLRQRGIPDHLRMKE